MADTKQFISVEKPLPNVTAVRLMASTMVSEIDLQAFKQQLDQVLNNLDQGTTLLVDFQSVQFVSSSFLSNVVRAMQAAKKCGGHLIVCGVLPEVEELFKITRLDRMFEMAGTLEEALDEVRRNTE